MPEQQPQWFRPGLAACAVGLLVSAAFVAAFLHASNWFAASPSSPPATSPRSLHYQPRSTVDTGGFQTVVANVTPWPPTASLQEISDVWKGAGYRGMRMID